MNIELAKVVLKQITTHPEEHHQHYWECDWWPELPNSVNPNGFCGTTRCIAGWTAYFAGEPQDWSNPEGQGARLLGLKSDVAYDLFHTMDNDLAVVRLTTLIEEAERHAL